MNIVNEPIRHSLYGDGKVISQEADILSVQFSEQYGIKKFLYPDAFERYLKLYNSSIETEVLVELHDKQARMAEEELRKQQEYEDKIRNRMLEKNKACSVKKGIKSKKK